MIMYSSPITQIVEVEWVNPMVVVFDYWLSWRHCPNRQPFEKQPCVKIPLVNETTGNS